MEDKVSYEYINKLVYLAKLKNELDYLCLMGMESKDNAKEILEYVEDDLFKFDQTLSEG